MDNYINELSKFDYTNYINIKNLHKNIEYNKNNILITQLKDLGDFICLTPFLKNLRNKTDGNIIFCCHEHIKELVEHCPYIDRIVYINKEIHTIDKNLVYSYLIPIIKNILNTGSIKLAINPYWSEYDQLVNLIHFLCGASRRICYDETCYQRYLSDKDFSSYKRNVALYTQSLFPPKEIIHEVERNNYIIKYLFNDVKEYDLETFITDEDHVNIDKSKINISVGLGGSSLSKCYPYEKLVKVFNEFPNINFLLLGTRNVNYIPNNCVDYINKLTIRQAISVIQQSNLYLGNDTFYVHAAAAKKIPSIVLYKESEAKYNYYKKKGYNGYLSSLDRWYPYHNKYIALLPKKSLFPCNKKEIIICGCEYNQTHCISGIKEKDIINAIKKLL